MTEIPRWLHALQPLAEPSPGPLRVGSPLVVWHVEVALSAWHVPNGEPLSGTDNWNGKALVVGHDSGIDRSVGEVEVAARLRQDGSSAGWTGKPREPWSRWAVDPVTRGGWLAEVDREVRRGIDLLMGNAQGLPDVLRWTSGRADFCCIEYKGPSPTNPTRADKLKGAQEAWLASACRLGLVSNDRVAVVVWRPGTNDAAILGGQAAASKLGRGLRNQVINAPPNAEL